MHYQFLIFSVCLVMAIHHGQSQPQNYDVPSYDKEPSHDKEYRYDYKYSSKANGWLKFHRVPVTWQEARMICHAEGAVLASPLTEQLKSEVISFVSKNRRTTTLVQRQEYSPIPNYIFTGVHATFSNGIYASIEGVPLLRLSISWAQGEPDNFNNAESCLAMTTDHHGSMSDIKCSDVLPYVCYKQDTDLTFTSCGTTDPEYILKEETGSCYKFHKRGLPWSQAYMTCISEGGYLVIINSDLEAEVVKNIYSKYPDSSVYSVDPRCAAIGFHDWGERQTWLTIHGETLEEAGYQRWANDQPGNNTRERSNDAGQFCGSVFKTAKLNDDWCNVAMAFICEKSPDSLLK